MGDVGLQTTLRYSASCVLTIFMFACFISVPLLGLTGLSAAGQAVQGSSINSSTETYSLYFDGSDDQVELGDDPAFDVDEAITLEAWICTEDSLGGHQGIVGRWDSTQGVWVLFINNGEVMFQPNPTTVLTAQIGNINGEWHHVAATYSETDQMMHIYLDGEILANKTNTNQIATGDRPLIVGSFDGIKKFKGRIDNVGVYSEALNASVVQQHANLNFSNLPGVVGFWDFDQPDINTAFDSSGNGFDGNIVGARWTGGAYLGNEAPVLFSDGTVPGGFAGENFTFRGDPYEYIEMTGFYAEYGYQGEEVTNVTLEGTGPFTQSITLQNSPLKNLFYKMSAVDAVGTWYVADVVEVPVFMDNSTAYAGTGDAFTFELMGSISPEEAFLEYWYDAQPVENVSLGGDFPLRNNITVAHQLGVLNHRYVLFLDGEWLKSGVLSREIVDNDGPECLSDDTDALAETGAPFYFDFTLADNVEVAGVTLEYWFGTDDVTTVNFSGAGPHTHSVPVPVNSTQELHYRITVRDTSNNVQEEDPVDVTVADVLSPSGFSDHSDAFATTGDACNLSFRVFDNIGLAQVNLTYWYGSGEPVVEPLHESGGFYNASVMVPMESTDLLHYWVRAEDASGNAFASQEKGIAVSDDDPPVLMDDATDEEAFTGRSVRFNFTIHDNIGVARAHLVYGFGSGYDANQTLTQVDNFYIFSTTVPSSSTAPLHYHLASVDDEGNWMRTPVANVSVFDDVSPSNLTDLSDEQAFTGDPFTWAVQVDDNIGVASVHVIYRYAGEKANETMSKNETYLFTTEVPDLLDDLHYHFAVTDEAGNWLVTETVNISVADDDPPILLSVEVNPETPLPEAPVNITVCVTDNVGVDSVHLDLFYKDENWTFAMVPGEDDLYHLSRHFNQTGFYEFVIRSRDASGVHHFSVCNFTVFDVEKPELAVISRPERCSPFDAVSVEVEVRDHSSVSGILCVKNPDGEFQTWPMTPGEVFSAVFQPQWPGAYELMVNATDSWEHSNSTKEWTLEVNLTSGDVGTYSSLLVDESLYTFGPGEKIVIIVNASGYQEANQLHLIYRDVNDTVGTRPFDHLEGDVWICSIPAQEKEGTVEYHVFALDEEGYKVGTLLGTATVSSDDEGPAYREYVIWGALIFLLLVSLVVLYFASRKMGVPRDEPNVEDEKMRMLRERFEKGEVSEETYKDIKERYQNAEGGPSHRP